MRYGEPEDADIRETPVNATTYWTKLKKTGWLNHLPVTSHNEIREQLAQNLADNPHQAYVALAQGFIEPGEGSPAEILRKLAEASNSLFMPTEIKESMSAKTVRFSFQWQQEMFAGEFSNDPTAIMEETIAMANHALAGFGREVRFAVLDFIDGGLIVVVPPSVLQKARKAKLIPGRRTEVEFVIGPENQISEFARPARKNDKSRSHRFHYEDLTIDAFCDLMQRLTAGADQHLREVRSTSDGTVVLQLAPETVTRLLSIKKGELNLMIRDWLKGSTMQDSPFADEVAYCTDRFAGVIGFLKEKLKPKSSVFACVRPC
ncbi:MAG: hypothetical protein U0941_08990 [Planctomycetaceae bacterium]